MPGSKYFKDEAAFELLAPLKERWRLFRSEVDAFLEDPALDKKGFTIPTSARRAMRSEAWRWKTYGFLNHGTEPDALMAEYGVESPFRAAREYVKAHHFQETTPFLREYAADAGRGVINAFLSFFAPGARLGLHINHDPYMYRAHLGLRVPEGDVRLKVGDETASWQEGGVLVFAPTDPHTSWNLTPEWRVVLIVDFFKPEEDRTEMVALERAQFAELMRKHPGSFGMSGGMFELDEETKLRFAVPRIESRLEREERRSPER